MSSYETVIGLEVHAQLLTRSKLFSPAAADYGASPNTHISPVCLGLPGALPVPNRAAVEMALRAGLALGCRINLTSRFERKHYFYPDLPKGYQISQFETPLAEHGELLIEVEGKTSRIGITRIHMEEDAAKNIHGTQAEGKTLVDFNRSGVALIEIVSEPDLRSGAEAESYLKKLREVLMCLGVNDGNLEEGSFRCDANVSVRPAGQEAFGTRTELKNINSFRFVRKAIEYEAQRQEAVVRGGGLVVQETRTWSEGQGKTITMRSKEEAHDYRYFPDPDLPPLRLSEAEVQAARGALPELPAAMRQRWQAELGLTEYDAQVLSGHPAVAAYFQAVVAAISAGARPEVGKRVANFVQSEVLRHVHTTGLQAEFPVPAERLGDLLQRLSSGEISGKMAKDVFAVMAQKGSSAQAVMDAQGLAQVSDAASLEAEVRQVLDAHPAEVQKYREGKVNLFGFFVGRVMKNTRGAANPQLVNDLLKRLLG